MELVHEDVPEERVDVEVGGQLPDLDEVVRDGRVEERLDLCDACLFRSEPTDAADCDERHEEHH